MPGDAEKVELLVAAGGRREPELRALVEHAVEVRVGFEGLPLELRVEPFRRRLRAVRLRQQVVVEKPALLGHAVESVVPLELELRGQRDERGHARQEDRGGLAASPGTDESADRLREVERCRGRRRVDPDGEARHVDALGDHAHGDHPP